MTTTVWERERAEGTHTEWSRRVAAWRGLLGADGAGESVVKERALALLRAIYETQAEDELRACARRSRRRAARAPAPMRGRAVGAR